VFSERLPQETANRTHYRV